MKAGRRIPSPTKKKLAGTFRSDRHGDIVEIAPSTKSVPIQPDYLSADAKAVWKEEHPRVVACGATEIDSSIFARYCEMEATFRKMIREGNPPIASLLTELRRTAELLGIGGLRSRLARIETDKPKASPFTVRK